MALFYQKEMSHLKMYGTFKFLHCRVGPFQKTLEYRTIRDITAVLGYQDTTDQISALGISKWDSPSELKIWLLTT